MSCTTILLKDVKEHVEELITKAIEEGVLNIDAFDAILNVERMENSVIAKIVRVFEDTRLILRRVPRRDKKRGMLPYEIRAYIRCNNTVTMPVVAHASSTLAGLLKRIIEARGVLTVADVIDRERLLAFATTKSEKISIKLTTMPDIVKSLINTPIIIASKPILLLDKLDHHDFDEIVAYKKLKMKINDMDVKIMLTLSVAKNKLYLIVG